MTKAKSKFGRIYKKWRIAKNGSRIEQSTWTVRYKGKDYATGETSVKMAEKFLLAKAGDIARGDKPGAIIRDEKPTETVILMDELFDGLNVNARRKRIATARQNEGQINLHLRPFFGAVPATALTSALIDKYIDDRVDREAAAATINRELALLKRSLRIALKRDPPQILRVPNIEMLPVSNARQGFVSHQQYVTLRDCLPPYLALIFVAGYHVGSRRGELVQVELPDLELNAPQPQFRLYPDATKNGEGRVIPIYGDMIEAFRQQVEMTQRLYPGCTWLFHNQGEPIQTFYKAWKTATELAGLSGLLFHDLRRTAVRNLIRSGVDRKVARDITGHKTEAVFDRYNITDEKDLRDAADKMTTFLGKLDEQTNRPSTLVS